MTTRTIPIRHLRAAVIPFLLALIVPGCSTSEVRSDHDPAFDFTTLHDYAWILPSSEPNRLANLDSTIREEIRTQLGNLGLHEVLGGEPEFLVRYRVTVEEKVEINDPYYAFHEVENYDVGTLLIEFIEPKARHVIWLGSASARLRDESSLDERAERAREAVRTILSQYPPPPAGR